MLCSKCDRDEATTEFIPVVNGKPQTTIHLCRACAQDPRPPRTQAVYTRVTPQEFARLQSDARAAESFFAPKLDDVLEELERALEESADPEKLLARRQEQKGGERYLFIGTDWHALHFLLTGDRDLESHSLPPTLLGKMVRGGTETPWPCTYGHVRSFTPDEVRAVADALTQVSVHNLRARFSGAALNAAQIIPRPGRAHWTDEDAESVFEIYSGVVEFFTSTARDGDMMLLSLH